MAHSQLTPACEDVVKNDIKASSSKIRTIYDKISDSDIRDIPKILGPVDLKRFYYSSVFGLQRVEVNRIEYDNKGDGIEVTACRVLQTWRKRKGSEATRGKILQALEDSENMDARRKLKEKWNITAGTAEEQLHQNMKVCKEELIKSYKHEMSKVQLLPWCDDTRDMDDIYVSLELEEQGYRKSSQLEKNEDLVTLKTRQDMPATRVLVKGVAGSGKSTLLARLAYNWAQQSSDSPLAKFELLFMISLREVERDSSLIDAIFQQILAHDTRVSKDDLQRYIKSHSESIIILFDGFDEYKTKNLLNEQKGINGILAFKLMRDCCVFLSTRPYEHLGSHQSHYISVKLTGFSLENVKFYIAKFFLGDTDVIEGLYRRLIESKILRSLSTIPVMLMLICLLWEDEQKLPDTQSKLYHEFTLYLWRKYCIKLGIKFDVEGDCGEEDFINNILGLGCVALAGLCSKRNIDEEKLVFTESDFDKSLGLFDAGCSIGLLTRERLRSRLNRSSAVTFLHKSFQEFCAAKYWANLLKTNPGEFYATLMQIKTWDMLKSKIELLKFCCGIVHKIGAIAIAHHGLHIYKKECCHTSTVKVDHLQLIQDIHITPILTLLYESQLFSNNLSVNNLILKNEHMVNQSFQQLTNIDDFNKTLRSLFTGSELEVYDHPPQIVPIFHHFVKSTLGLSSLNSVKSFMYSHIPVDVWAVIGDTLACMPQLQKVDIRFNTEDATPFSQFHFKRVCEHLTKLSNLREIHLSEGLVCLTPDIVASILDSIQSKIERVSMHSTHVAEAIEHIGHIMTPHLQILELGSAMLKEDHIKVLSDFLPKAINLQKLDLYNNTVGVAIVPLAQQLQCCIRLDTLILEETQLTDQDVIELAERFALFLNLSWLDISGNGVTNTGAHSVFKNLHHLTKLQLLDIDAQVDNQCSALVKECVTAIGKKIPDTGFLDICGEFGVGHEEPFTCEDLILICTIGRKHLK